MPMMPVPDMANLSLADIARLAAEQRSPPVEQWNPDRCGDSEMRIARDGTWYHQGSPIRRETLVRLFSSILRREPDGHYVLVTPAEKLDIVVEEAPFTAVELKTQGTGRDRQVAFRLNIGDMVVAGPGNRLFLRETDDGHRPYLHVRDGLEALVLRSVFYELANIAVEEEDSPAGLWSQGVFFPLDAAA